MSTPVYSNPTSVYPPLGYSHVSTSEGTTRVITIAGQVGQDASGATDPAFEAQVAQAFGNLRACLAASGATASNVTKLNYYIVDYDPSKLAAIGEGLRVTFRPDRLPPCTLVPVPALASPEFLFEIDATAAICGDQNPKLHDKVVDVVVVGAGLSGLEAARQIQASGLSCVVLEAMDRVGGKTLSVPSGPGRTTINDIGAAWTNDTNQSEVNKLFQRYHLVAEIQRTEGKNLHQGRDGKTMAIPYGESAVSPSRHGSGHDRSLDSTGSADSKCLRER